MGALLGVVRFDLPKILEQFKEDVCVNERVWTNYMKAYYIFFTSCLSFPSIYLLFLATSGSGNKTQIARIIFFGLVWFGT